MKELKLTMIFMRDEDLVAQYTDVMMECCADFPESKARFEAAIGKMKAQLGEETVNNLTSALTTQIASEIRFSFVHGIRFNAEKFHSNEDFDNTMRFLLTVSKMDKDGKRKERDKIYSIVEETTFKAVKYKLNSAFRSGTGKFEIDENYDDILQEEIMAGMPNRTAAMEIAFGITKTFSEEIKELYDDVIDYHCFLENICYKLAHYFGYCVGNKLLYDVEPGYMDDSETTLAYQRLISDYLGCVMKTEF